MKFQRRFDDPAQKEGEQSKNHEVFQDFHVVAMEELPWMGPKMFTNNVWQTPIIGERRNAKTVLSAWDCLIQ